MERKQIEYKAASDHKFEQIFNAIEERSIKPKQGIFFDGQIFDAYQFLSSLKDLGKKWFDFSKMDIGMSDMLKKLEGM